MIFDLLGLSLLIFAFWTPTMPLVSQIKLNRLSKQKGACMIVSDPCGAEIWINRNKSKWLTPALIELPLNQEAEIHLQKEHYKTHRAWIRSSHELSFYYRTLEKIKLILVSEATEEK